MSLVLWEEDGSLITTKLIKKASPLMVVLAILAVCGTLVGAAVLITATSNNVTTQIIGTNGIMSVHLGNPQYPADSSGIATDKVGVNYALDVTNTRAVTGVTISVTITGPTPTSVDPAAQTVTIPNLATGTTTQTAPAGQVTYTLSVPNQGVGVSSYTLNIVYDHAGTYTVTATEGGSAV